jgi:surfactin synthase thioesterase subunit
MTLLWVSDGSEHQWGGRWRRGMAPEVELAVVRPMLTGASPPGPVRLLPVRALAHMLAGPCRAAAGDRPYAIAGCGPWAVVGFELACLLAQPRAPVLLLVAGYPPPAAVTGQPPGPHPPAPGGRGSLGKGGGWVPDLVGYQPSDARRCCPITAFAGPDEGSTGAGQMSGWQAATARLFTLRLLPSRPAAWLRPSAQTLLAVKEELGVWPL